jgi:AcrR family transcriptional regulator
MPGHAVTIVAKAGKKEPAAASAARRTPRNARDRLQTIAARLFGDFGYAGTSMRNIAKRAGVEPSAIYYHFPSKQALLDAVLEASILQVYAMVSRASEDQLQAQSPRDRVKAAIEAHVRAISKYGDHALASRRLMSQIPAASRRRHEEVRAMYGDYWQRLLEEATAANGSTRTESNLAIVRMFLLGALNWTTEWFDPKKKSPAELAEVFCGILFDGLARQGPPHPSRSRRQVAA